MKHFSKKKKFFLGHVNDKTFVKLFILSICRTVYLYFWLSQQQLEQLQKELNFLEEDIKRVEVK